MILRSIGMYKVMSTRLATHETVCGSCMAEQSRPLAPQAQFTVPGQQASQCSCRCCVPSVGSSSPALNPWHCSTEIMVLSPNSNEAGRGIDSKADAAESHISLCCGLPTLFSIGVWTLRCTNRTVIVCDDMVTASTQLAGLCQKLVALETSVQIGWSVLVRYRCNALQGGGKLLRLSFAKQVAPVPQLRKPCWYLGQSQRPAA